MNKLKTIIFTAFIAFLIISPANTSELSTPEDTVNNFIEAYKNLDWNKAVNYLHPDMINDIRDQILNIIRRVKKSEVQDILTEYGVETLAELEKMPPTEFYVKNQNRWIRDTRPNLKQWKNARYKLVNSIFVSEDEYLIGLRCIVKLGSKVKERHSVYTVKLIENEWKILKSVNKNN